MILFISNYPDREGEKDGMMQRVLAIDRQFSGSDRIYLGVRFFGNLRRRTAALPGGLTVHEVNFFLHLSTIMGLGSNARGIYIHSVHNSFRALPLYLFRNVVTDLHGVFPEELRYYGKRAGALLYGVIEKLAVLRSRALVVVSDAMAEHLRRKYGEFPARLYTIPVFDDSPVGSMDRDHAGSLVAIYSGGSQKWQNIDLVLEAMAKTLHEYSHVILTPDIRFFEEKLAEYGLSGRVKALSVPKGDVYGYYQGADLGFVLRDASIVNRAACPTKLVEYLACGVIPIVLQPEIGDFARRGYACIGLQQFMNGDLPPAEELAAMRARNYRVLQDMRDSAVGAMARMAAELTAQAGSPGVEPDRSACAGADGKRFRVAGVVVLYHPGEELPENIASYAGQVDVLFAIDNSERGTDTDTLAAHLGESGNVVRIANGRNLGVAAALNMGARLALEHRCDYLLTMDQDSRAAPGMLDEMLAGLNGPAASRIGIVAPCLLTKPGQEQSSATCFEDVPMAMTSGSLLNLAAFASVGPFREELFVDFVDMEYCLRLCERGFRIVRANHARLEHHVGRLLKFRLFARDLYLTSHSPLRKYYKTRNRFFVADLYRKSFPAFRRADRVRFLLEFVRLLFFEDEKREKLAMMRRGYADYRSGRMGRYDAEKGGSAT